MSDLLSSGTERDPWRPSRRLVGAVALALVLLAALAFGGRELQHRRASSAAAERAAQKVVLEVGHVIGDPDWTLNNVTATGITVTSARLDFPPGELLSEPQRLHPYGSLYLRPGRGACDQGLYERGPASLMVAAVTQKGVHLTRKLTLDADVGAGLWSQLQDLCRMVRPADALVGELVAATWTGRSVRLTYAVSNNGAWPLTVENVTYLPGVSITSRPRPLVLPVRPQSVTFGPVQRLVVELRVSSCARLEVVLRDAHGGDGLDGPATLKPQLQDAHIRESGYLELGEHAERLQRTCPSIAALLDSWR